MSLLLDDDGGAERERVLAEAAELHAACNRVVAVTNNKGGVLKTSTVANVAGHIATHGPRVLIVDLDSQGDILTELGVTQTTGKEGAGQNLLDAVLRGTPLVPSHPEIRPNLDVIGADGVNTELLAMWMEKNQSDDRHLLALARVLAPIAPNYDLILIDVPPKQKHVRKFVMATARHVVIPTQADAASREGMVLVAEQFKDARRLNPALNLLGVVVTLIGVKGTVMRSDARQDVIDDFGTDRYLFDTIIRLAESPARAARNRGVLAHELEGFVTPNSEIFQRLRNRTQGQPVERAIPQTAVGLSSDYFDLTQEILARVQQHEEAMA